MDLLTGIYYGLVSSDYAETTITIINSKYGLKVSTDNNSKIVKKDTGFTLNNSNSFVTNIQYSSGLTNPNIAVSLYRRNYDTIYSQNYDLVDLADYVTTALTNTSREKEYFVSNNPTATSLYFLNLGENLMTGTYKIVFKLYDENNYIGEAYEYVIIK